MMNVTYKKRFLRDLDKMPEQIKHKVQEIVFEKIPKQKDIQEIKGIKKIQGFSRYYRLRISDYRIGFIVKMKK